ncbi:competence protein ComK [Staphylococcus sp. 17KM0847]|uniref:competence protein ComK n=1 Tax=Staphylococcus sp. 17KM0847 TaxID=2583989 RepID=UPI0015DCB605|nr:competence protein ComK [Staphylococcus sp. 17KM0847]QLK86309.1 hypothetical protein FGL66_06030 [Staphylococcus sp. 17KM0847]
MSHYLHGAFESLMYIKSSNKPNYRFDIHCTTHHYSIHLTLSDILQHILNAHHKHLKTQQQYAYELLNTYHLVPIYVTSQLVLCPLQSRRASLQYYINMSQVVGMSSQNTDTIIFFPHNESLIVPYPFLFCVKKWKSAQTLIHLMEN